MNLQQAVQLGALAGVQPGGWLVETEQHRVGAHGAGNFEPALLAVGEGARVVVGTRDETGAIEPVARLSTAARSAER